MRIRDKKMGLKQIKIVTLAQASVHKITVLKAVDAAFRQHDDTFLIPSWRYLGLSRLLP